jgi:CRISPR-associated protein Csb2
MGTTLAFRFPLGRYHATPWDRSVNEGAVEWPPSPWRLLRALIATWYTRWPDLPASALDGLLDALADPPSYLTPDVRPGHTRHYLPDLDHKSGEPGATDLTLDPFLVMNPGAEILVRWGADLDGDQRQVLAKLAELLPYLGRAESVCEARLLDADPLPDETWWQPGAATHHQTRLLAPARPLSRAVLEASTAQVRKDHRVMPPGTMWVSYAEPAVAVPPVITRRATGVEAIRFAVDGKIPLRSRYGILLADAVHRQVARKLDEAGLAGHAGDNIMANGGAATDHQHAHWLPLADGTQRNASVQALIVWVPRGLKAEDVAAMITLRRASGKLGGQSGYEVRGFPPVNLLFQAAGTIDQVAPELCRPARRWRSLTPYLPVRHQKRETLNEFLATDVLTELRYRGYPPAAVTPVSPGDGLPDRWARDFRRYRMKENMGKSRPGLGLQLEFADQTHGPLLIGQLSHFGYGILIPEPY